MSKVNTGQAPSTLIPKYIGSDFDKVIAVADNIEQVVLVGDNIEDVGTVADNINYVKEVAEDLHGMPVTMYTGETPPVLNPMPEGVMWYCTTDGRTYVWYTDADSGQWVESAPQSAMKDEATNIFLHSVPSNVNPAYRSATLYSTPSPEAEISVAHNTLNTPVVQAQFIREEALWVDVSVIGAQGIVTLMGYSSGNSQLKAEIITWKNGAEGTSLGASQWVTLPSQPSVVSLPVTLANIDVLDAGDSYVVKLTSQMSAGGSAVSTILVDGNTSSRFGIIFNTNLIGLNDGIRDGVTTSAPTENAVYDALQLKVGKSQFVQSGNLTSAANWANVPAYSDSELGGSDGPLNAQAKALTARSELLLTDVRESLRRSYADAGYNLVDGSFEAGGTLVNANDVLLQERTGKAYTGPAGTVAAGTNPASGGFVDVSQYILRHQTELALSSTAEMVQKAIIEQGLTKRFNTGGTSWNLYNTSLPITMDNFRAFNAIYVGDLYDGSGDYSDALQGAINKAFIDGCDVFLGGDTKRITKTITIPMGLNYQHQGTHIYGMGRGKSVLDFDNVNRGSYAIAGFQQHVFDATHGYANCILKDFSMTNSYGNPSDISAMILMESATGCLWDNLHLSQCITGIHFTDDAWLNSFTNIFIAPRDYGFRMDNSGTTNWWHGLFVYRSNVTAYKLRSGYSAIGALAADDCTGTAYDLRFFRGSVGALGTEQPTQGRVLSKLLQVDNGSVKIGSLLAFRGVPNSGSWVGVELGAGQVSIDDFVVDSHDQTAGDKVSTGRLIDGVTGDIKIRNLVVKKDSNGINPGTLTLATSTLQNAVVSIENPNGTAVAVAGDGHPAIAGSRYNVSPFANITSKGQIVQSIVFDNYGNPKHGGSTLDNKYRYTNGYQSGSIFVENAPARWGCAGYVATNTSNDIDGQTTIPIAAVNTAAPTAPHVGVSYFDTATNKPYWWNGSVWKDAAGVTKP